MDVLSNSITAATICRSDLPVAFPVGLLVEASGLAEAGRSYFPTPDRRGSNLTLSGSGSIRSVISAAEPSAYRLVNFVQTLFRRPQLESGCTLANLSTVCGPFFNRFSEVEPYEDA